jgi:hypothetical protein
MQQIARTSSRRTCPEFDIVVQSFKVATRARRTLDGGPIEVDGPARETVGMRPDLHQTAIRPHRYALFVLAFAALACLIVLATA